VPWQPFPEGCKAADFWLEFIDDQDTKYFFLEGAVRSSKTFGSICAYCDAVENKFHPGPLIMMGRTERTLRQNVLDPLMEMVGPSYSHLNMGMGELTLFGRKNYLFGAPNIAAMFRLQGKGGVGAYCDEANIYPYEVWQMLGTRAAADGIQIISTMNPGNPRSWMKLEYLDRLEEVNGRAWHFTLDDNPFLSEKTKRELRTQYTGLWYKRYILGLWVSAEGAIYDMFSEQAHVIHDLPKRFSEIVVGVDYGTANPTAFVMLGRSADAPYLGKWIVMKEFYYHADPKKSARQKTDKELSDEMKHFLNGIHPSAVMVDPSAASFKVQLKRDGIEGVRDADNSVIDGIRDVATSLTGGQLLINESCTHLLDEIPGYCWDKKAQDKGEDKPIKQDDHACLAPSTLIETAAGLKRIDQITISDKVLSGDGGFHEVLDVSLTDLNSDVYEVTFSNGQKLIATGNHPIYIDNIGWRSVDSLRYGFIVRTPNSIAWDQQKKFDIRESCTDDTQNLNAGMIEYITNLMDLKERRIIFIESFMKRIVEKFPKDLTYTTKTAIHSTMHQKTLKHLNRLIMSLIMGNEDQSNGWPITENTWKKLDRWPRNGMVRRRGENGMKSMPLMPGWFANPLKKVAIIAGMILIAFPDAKMIDSVQTRANLHGDAQADWMTKKEHVRSVESRLKSIDIQKLKPVRENVVVLSVKKLNARSPVYNLTVAESHNFFANGILTHNCDALRYACRRVFGRRLT
jgi:PBSX family phage terminase large subunit